mmetsp:Transcript_20202/g.51171  ORF Transcript_20202/g.51171 Transcript_20202/m.51171 type:complete len:249 (-) Transcript_20202:284-1030(-)|eukprot:CAMPEP_0202863656 /NCGR_PEP_ID=MMETSP1391-20130828/4204_1 /ASSEMBLY_ACC=CAM_ASM_000867 /TAXON_ID=1034604 /ORGANISM="Chlamydomonas leiostraca, Strain SAG 11-49" /LENGTH=248 /DNA_ID=CAMNT_0049543315 /DNA_START=154 /DNA_END=900 /DNA_ORIENTATION=-
MQEEDFDRELKVLVVGNGGVGKTSMIRRFCKGMFTDEYKKTIGVDFLEKALYVDALGEEVRFMLWDTAGQEEFDAITRGYYRGAGAAVIAFSTTDRASFEAVSMWKNKVESECGDIAMAMVQNKVDLVDHAVVSPEEVEALARKLGLRLYRTCVKENINVTEVFVYLAELHQRKLAAGQLGAQQQQEAAQSGPGGSVGEPLPDRNNNTFGLDDNGERQQHARTVDIAPSKQRTKGKKSFKDRMSCSVV